VRMTRLDDNGRPLQAVQATVAVPVLLTTTSGGDPYTFSPRPTVAMPCFVHERIRTDGHGTGFFRTGRRATRSGVAAVADAAAWPLGAAGGVREGSPPSQPTGTRREEHMRTAMRVVCSARRAAMSRTLLTQWTSMRPGRARTRGEATWHSWHFMFRRVRFPVQRVDAEVKKPWQLRLRAGRNSDTTTGPGRCTGASDTTYPPLIG
jgi:hypothetical protein